MDHGPDTRRTVAGVDHHADPASIGYHGPDSGPAGDLGCCQLRRHAAAAPNRSGRTGEAFELLVDLDDLLDERSLGVHPGVGCEETRRVSQEHQGGSVDEVGHKGGDAVVVAEPDLIVGNGVVLINHRHHAEFQQTVQGPPGVQVLGPHEEIQRGQ